MSSAIDATVMEGHTVSQSENDKAARACAQAKYGFLDHATDFAAMMVLGARVLTLGR